jgi:hypothetical protein
LDTKLASEEKPLNYNVYRVAPETILVIDEEVMLRQEPTGDGMRKAHNTMLSRYAAMACTDTPLPSSADGASPRTKKTKKRTSTIESANAGKNDLE